MKKLYFAAAAVVSMLIFTGCPGNGPAPVEPNSGLITEIAGDGDRIAFTYDAQNRLTSVAYDDGEYIEYAYPDATTITETTEDGVNTYKLNASGYVEKISFPNKIDPYTVDFTYQNHYLKNFTTVFDEDDQETITFIWESGNLKTVATPGYELYSFKYGTTANKASIDLNYFFVIGDMPGIPGFLGKPSAKLATEATFDNNDSPPHTTKFRYNTDVHGYVTEIHVTDGSDPEVSYTLKYK